MEPCFRYCCPVWGNAGVTVTEKLQKLQNRAAKLVTNSPIDATALPVIRALQWPTVRELIDFQSQKMVFRSLKGDAPSNDLIRMLKPLVAQFVRLVLATAFDRSHGSRDHIRTVETRI